MTYKNKKIDTKVQNLNEHLIIHLKLNVYENPKNCIVSRKFAHKKKYFKTFTERFIILVSAHVGQC